MTPAITEAWVDGMDHPIPVTEQLLMNGYTLLAERFGADEDARRAYAEAAIQHLPHRIRWYAGTRQGAQLVHRIAAEAIAVALATGVPIDPILRREVRAA